MEEGQQQEHLSHTDGRHHEDEEDEDGDFLRRQDDFLKNLKTKQKKALNEGVMITTTLVVVTYFN